MRKNRKQQSFWQRELLEYAEGVHRLQPPASEEGIAAAEGRLGRALDGSLRAFLAQADGASFFHDSYRIFSCAEIEDDRFGEEGQADLAIDSRGRVNRIEVGADQILVVGSTLDHWLSAIFAREDLCYDRQGEFKDVFDADGVELRVEILRKREQRALRHDEGAAASHYELGRLFAHGGQLSRALDSFSRALELAPGFVWAHFELGRAHMRKGETATAVEAFTAAARADRDSAAIFYAWGARAAAEASDAALGSQLRARVRLLEPDFATRHKELGKKLIDEDDANAAEMLALALAIDPRDEEIAALLRAARAKRGGKKWTRDSLHER